MSNPWMREGCPLNSTETLSTAPGTSILSTRVRILSVVEVGTKLHSLLALKPFHHIQELAIYLWSLLKRSLYRIQVWRRVLDI